MYWHPQLLQLLSQQVNNDSALMQAAQRYMPVAPVLGAPQALGAGGQTTSPQGPQAPVGSMLAAAANKSLRKPMRSRSDWQTIGPVLNQE
jgi:hypothetical protein